MIVETLRTVKDYEGKDVEEPRVEPDGHVSQVPVTYRMLIWHALNSQGQQNEALWNPDEKLRLFELTEQLYKPEDGRVEFGPADRAFIMERSKKISSPLYHGRLCAVLQDPIDDELEANATAHNDDAAPE